MLKPAKTFKRIVVASAAPTVTEAPKVVTSSSLASVFVAEETQKLIAEQVAILNTSIVKSAVGPALTNRSGLPGYTRLFNESAGGKGYKVWDVYRSGCDMIVSWGAEYATKQTKTTSYSSESLAESAIAKLISQKRSKGYRENK